MSSATLAATADETARADRRYAGYLAHRDEHRPPATSTRRRIVTYRCRDIGYGVEEGITEGWWSCGCDTWGKRPFTPLHGGSTLYLFPDEVVSDVKATP